MHDMTKHRDPRYKLMPAGIEETMRLFYAWLGYLLTLINADTLRVKASDITAALDNLSCTVTREGEEYVIRLDRREGK